MNILVTRGFYSEFCLRHAVLIRYFWGAQAVSNYVALVGLELKEICLLLPLPPDCLE